MLIISMQYSHPASPRLPWRSSCAAAWPWLMSTSRSCASLMVCTASASPAPASLCTTASAWGWCCWTATPWPSGRVTSTCPLGRTRLRSQHAPGQPVFQCPPPVPFDVMAHTFLMSHLHPRRFLHPLHNFALVSYDPRELPPETRRLVHAAELAPGPLHRGDAITLAGVTKDLRVMQRKSVVTNSTLALSIHSAEVPRWGGGPGMGGRTSGGRKVPRCEGGRQALPLIRPSGSGEKDLLLCFVQGSINNGIKCVHPQCAGSALCTRRW